MNYQWLKNYRENEEHLAYLKWILNKSQLELTRWSQDTFEKIRLEKNCKPVFLEMKIQSIKNEIFQIEKRMEEIQVIFSSLEETDRQIMKLKYLDSFTLKEIADMLSYSRSYIRKRHAEIRRRLDFLDNYLIKRQDRLDKPAELEICKEKLRK